MILTNFWNRIFPFYLRLDKDLIIVSAGESMLKLYPNLIGSPLSEVATFIRPKFPLLAYDTLITLQEQLVILTTKQENHTFRGQLIQESENTLMLCLGLWITNLEELKGMGLLLTDFALHDPITELLQILKFQNNTTEELLKQTEALRRSKKVAEQALRTRQNFMSVMTHEIRTPLNAIIGMTNILLEESPKPEQLDDLNTLRFSANNLLSLVNDILDFSKIEAGKLTLDRQEADLGEMVMQIVKTLLPKANEQGIKLLSEFDSALPDYLWIDAGRFCQILINLVGNAIKFTHEGHVKVNIQVKGQVQKGWVNIQVAVEDTGIGIPKEKQKSILDPFTQVDAATHRKYGGTGLGLSITNKLLKLFGSELKISSEENKGSTFYFELSLEIGKRKPKLEILEEVENALPPNTSILVAEDNLINIKIVARYLRNWGLEVDIAHNGTEAVDKVRCKRYDIVLMDLLMPIKDGYDASIEIRKLSVSYAKELPIIALSASLFEEVEEKVRRSGMNDFLRKPFAKDELRAMLFKHIMPNNNEANTAYLPQL